MSRLRILLFCRFQAEFDGGSPISGLESRKVQELFSYLLLFRERPHSREMLADVLWGDNSGAQARKYLRQALWQLQCALKSQGDPVGIEILVVDPDWVRINTQADLWLDVAEFEGAYARAQGKPGHELDTQTADALRNAVELQPGGLLEGWYNDWCLFERERLNTMYLATLNKLMIHSEACQEFETGLLYGQRILQFDRAHERTHRRMMRLHYMAGDRTSALRQYERCVAALEDELGIRPARRTVALYEQIHAGHLREPLPPAPACDPGAESGSLGTAHPAQMDRLEALLAQVQQEVRQYMQVAGLAPSDQR